MKSQIPHFRLILPTDDIVEEYRQADTLLNLVDADVRQIMRYAADYYLHRDGFFDTMGVSQLQEMLGFLHTDYLYEHRYDRYDSRDIRDIRLILTSLATAVYGLVDEIISHQRLPDSVVRDLDIEGWLGDSMVISTEKDGLDNWKPPSKTSFLLRRERPLFSNGGW